MKEGRKKALSDNLTRGNSEKSLSHDTLQKRLETYAKEHKRTLAMSEYIKSLATGKKNVSLTHSLDDCGKWLLFRDYYEIDQVRLHRAGFCRRHNLCPLCGMRRALKMTQAYMPKIEEVLRQNPGLKAFLVTLTLKDGPDLIERLNHLIDSHRTMTQLRRDAIKCKRSPIEMNKALGGVYSIEIKRGENSGEWHVHLHAIWLCLERPWETLLSAEWHKITGDSFIVDVEEIRQNEEGISQYLEVFRYTMKFSTLTLADNYEAFLATTGIRMTNSFGNLRGVVVPEALEDEPIEDQPYFTLIYKYMNDSTYHLKAMQSKKL